MINVRTDRIDVGVVPNDGDGDNFRAASIKANYNFDTYDTSISNLYDSIGDLSVTVGDQAVEVLGKLDKTGDGSNLSNIVTSIGGKTGSLSLGDIGALSTTASLNQNTITIGSGDPQAIPDAVAARTPYDPGTGTSTATKIVVTGQGSSGDVSGMSSVATGQVARSLSSRLSDTFNVKDYGAVGDGQSHPLSQRFSTLAAAQAVYPFATALTNEIDWAAAQLAVNAAAVRGGGKVVYPQGYYVQNRTVTVSTNTTRIEGVAEDAAQILRRGDFGPTFRFANATSYLQGIGLRHLWLIDSDGSMTLANSPFHISADAITRSIFCDINISEGSGAIDVAGGDQIIVKNLYASFTKGSPGARIAVRIGPSGNTNLGSAPIPISDVWLQHVNIKGGVPTSANDGWHLNIGVQVLASDGIWISDSHVQGSSTANWEFNRATTASLGNIYATNIMSDLCNLHGILIDGAYPIQRASIDGWISGGQAAGDATTGGQGIYITGTGGSSNLSLSIGVDGHKSDAIKVDASNVVSTTIRLKQIRALGGSGSTAINLQTGARYSISGGIIDGDTTIGTGLKTASVADVSVSGLSITKMIGSGYVIGAGTSYLSMSGGQSSRNGAYGGTIENGANFVSIVGVPHVNNTTAALQNNMASGSFSVIANNLGT